MGAVPDEDEPPEAEAEAPGLAALEPPLLLLVAVGLSAAPDGVPPGEDKEVPVLGEVATRQGAGLVGLAGTVAAGACVLLVAEDGAGGVLPPVVALLVLVLVVPGTTGLEQPAAVVPAVLVVLAVLSVELDELRPEAPLTGPPNAAPESIRRRT